MKANTIAVIGGGIAMVSTNWLGAHGHVLHYPLPGAAARIQTAMIIGLALIESLAVYVLVVAMILLFVQPVK